MLRLTILRQASADDAVEGGEVAEAPELGGIYVVLMSLAGHKINFEGQNSFKLNLYKWCSNRNLTYFRI